MRRFRIGSPFQRPTGFHAFRGHDHVEADDGVEFLDIVGIAARDAVAADDNLEFKLLRDDAATTDDDITFRFQFRDAVAAADAVSISASQGINTYANGYQYSYRISAPARGTGTLTSFPLWIDVSKFASAASIQSDLRAVGQGGLVQSGNGWDIRFEDLNGVKLPHEIETYEPNTGLLRAFVRVTWNIANPLRIIMYFGKPDIAAAEADPAATWTLALAAIDPVTGEDRSGKGRNFTPSPTETPAAATLIGRAGTYTGNSYLEATGTTWMDDLPSMSFELWHDCDNIASDNDAILFRVAPSGNRNIVIRHDNTADVAPAGGTAATETLIFNTVLTGGERISCLSSNAQTLDRTMWTFGVSAGIHTIYKNKTAQTPSAQSGTATGNVRTNGNTARLGRASGINNLAATGTFGRLVIWPFVPTAAWVAATYDNQNDVPGFLGIGARDSAAVTNRSPVAQPISTTATAGTAKAVNVITSGLYNPDSDSVTCTAAGPASAGTVTRTTSVVTFTPPAGVAAVYRVPYVLADAASKSSSSVILFNTTVSSAPVAPTWHKQFFTAAGKTPRGNRDYNIGTSFFDTPGINQFNTLLGYIPHAIGHNNAGTGATPKRSDTWDRVKGGSGTNTSTVATDSQLNLILPNNYWISTSPSNTWGVLHMTSMPYNGTWAQALEAVNGNRNADYRIMGARLKWFIENNSGAVGSSTRKGIENVIIRINWEFNQDTGLAIQNPVAGQPDSFYNAAVNVGGLTMDQAITAYNDAMVNFAVNLWDGADYRVPIVLSPAQGSSHINANTKTVDQWIDTWMEAKDSNGRSIYDLICCSWHPQAPRSDTIQEAGECTYGLICAATGTNAGLPTTPLTPINRVLFTPGAAIRGAKRHGVLASALESGCYGPEARNLSGGITPMNGASQFYVKNINDLYDVADADKDWMAFINIHDGASVNREFIADLVPNHGYTTEHATHWRNMVDRIQVRARAIT